MALDPHVGLFVKSLRRDEPRELSWRDFMDEVSKAVAEEDAKRAKRGADKKRPGKSPKIDCLTDAWRNRTPDQQCSFVRKDGTQCRGWRMKGATRCHFHGGYRQNPRHPGTLKRYRKGDIAQTAARAQAVRACYEFPEQDRQVVWNILRQAGIAGEAGPVGALEGLQALKAGGKAWRRWTTQVRTRGRQKWREADDKET